MKEKTIEIHNELKILVERQRNALALVLEHLAALNQRKGFLEFGHPSLLKYCVKELKMSESSAYRRIKALRICEGSPEVKEKLKSGDLNLAQISRAQELFQEHRQENSHGKKEEISEYEKLKMLEEIQDEDIFSSENKLRKMLGMPQKPRRITVEVGEETFKAWHEYKAAMVHKDMSDEMLLCFAIQRATCVKAPLRKYKARKHDPNSRHIPAQIRRDLLKEASYQCSWNGCESKYGLEIDHIVPVSKGGKTEIENLRVLCRNHNQARNFG